MVSGSSGLDSSVISWTIALPMEVTRRERCAGLPSMSGCGGTVVTWPSQEPARALRLSKDFCASDFGPSVWAKGTAQSDSRTMRNGIRRRDFMFILLERQLWLGPGSLACRGFE